MSRLIFLVLDADLNSSALVVTVEETSIMCCSSGSFVSQGLFRNFCLRFANDFDSKAEEWIFAKDDIINTCKNFLVEVPRIYYILDECSLDECSYILDE